MSKFLGIVGLVLLGFGFGSGIFAGDFGNPLVLSHLILGVLALAAWFVKVGAKSMDDIKGAFFGRTARFGAMASVYSALALAFLVVVNIVISGHNKKWDLTEQGAYSLASQSEQAMKNLTQPLQIVAFSGIQSQDGSDAKELIERFHDANPSMVSTEYIDPRLKPQLIEKYEMKEGNLVYLGYGQGEKKSVSRLNDVTEESITNAVLKLTRGAAKKIYYVVGHDEPSLQADAKSFAEALSDENFTVSDIFLAQNAAVPTDAAAVILSAPKKPLLKEEKDMLIKYADEGGRLLLFSDPRGSEDVREIADHFGITIGNDVIIDQVQRLFAGPALGAQPVVRDYPAHAITKGLTPNNITIFNIASSVRSKGQPQNGATVTEFARTSITSWAESNIADVFDRPDATAKLEKDTGDIPGPVPLAAAYERKIVDDKKADDAAKTEQGAEAGKFDKTSRVVVYGDSDWVIKSNLQAGFNRDLALNSVGWLVGESGGISIRPRTLKTSGTQLIPKETVVSILILSLITPELILLLGLWIWWRRKSVTSSLA